MIISYPLYFFIHPRKVSRIVRISNLTLQLGLIFRMLLNLLLALNFFSLYLITLKCIDFENTIILY